MKGAGWRGIYYGIAWLAASILLAGCGVWPVTQPKPDVSLVTTGNVATRGTWDIDRLQSLGLMELVAMEPSGEEMIWEGVLLKDLLDALEPGPGASRVIFTNSSGDSVEMSLSEAQACQECLVAFDPRGIGLHLAMPDQPAELWVRNLVRIELR